jgi:hypothetical protein
MARDQNAGRSHSMKTDNTVVPLKGGKSSNICHLCVCVCVCVCVYVCVCVCGALYTTQTHTHQKNTQQHQPYNHNDVF